MQDMLRMMDVASALRRERESATVQLDAHSHKVALRERLMATAAASGEQLAEAEVDAAIEHYFAARHRYQEPAPGWGRFWAVAWVWRVRILVICAVFAGLVAGSMLLANGLTNATRSKPELPNSLPTSPAQSSPVDKPPKVEVAPLASSASLDEELIASKQFQRFDALVAVAHKTAADEDAQQRVAAIASKGELAQARGDLALLATTQSDLDRLLLRLNESYVVQIVSRPGQRSGVFRVDRDTGNVSGYYLIVEARSERGNALSRRIENAETGRSHAVRIWGEQVPKSVYDRIVVDKSADGVIDENVFARKLHGYFEERVELQDGTGNAIRRGRRITKWDN